MAMKNGDQGFFYHSNEGKAVVGIVEVIREYYPDHTDETGKFGMVDVGRDGHRQAGGSMPSRPEPKLKRMVLVKISASRQAGDRRGMAHRGRMGFSGASPSLARARLAAWMRSTAERGAGS